MQTLSSLDWEILNATADDWENLEQIYKSTCFDFSPENYQRAAEGSFYWRAATDAPLLETVADGILRLVRSDLLEARLQDQLRIDQNDISFVWRAWFRMTAEGKRVWAESENANLV